MLGAIVQGRIVRQSTATAQGVSNAAGASEAASVQKLAGMPFELLFEVCEAKEANISRLLSAEPHGFQTAGTAGPNNWGATVRDCSHESSSSYGGIESAMYTRVMAKGLRFGPDALNSINQTLALLARHAVDPGKTGAMRIHVPRDSMDEATTRRFFKLFTGYEDIFFRLGQNGAAGRPLNHKQRYCKPLSEDYSASTDMSRTDWESKLNANRAITSKTAGVWECRYLDSSLNAPAVEANVEALLSLVKAAHDGKSCSAPSTVAQGYNSELKRERWNAFLNDIGASDKLREQLEAQFVAAGGKLEPEPLTPADCGDLSRMLADHRILHNGQPLGDAKRIGRVIVDKGNLTVESPASPPLQMAAAAFPAFVRASGGRLAELPDDMKASFKAAGELRSSGVSLLNAQGQSVSLPAAMVLAHGQSGSLVTKKGDDAVPVGGANTLEQIRRLQQDGGSHALLKHVPFLQQRGFSFASRDGRPAAWAPRLAQLFDERQLTLVRGEQRTEVNDVNELDRKVLYPERYATLSDAARQNVDLATTLTQRNYRFGSADPGTSAFLDTLGQPQVSVTVGGRYGSVEQVPQPQLGRFLRLENGQLDELTPRERQTVDQLRDLRQGGYKLQADGYDNASMQRDLDAVARGSMQLSLPGRGRSINLNQQDVDTLWAVANNHTERLSEDQRYLLEQKDRLSTAGMQVMAESRNTPTPVEMLLSSSLTMERPDGTHVTLQKEPAAQVREALQPLDAATPTQTAAADDVLRIARERRLQILAAARPVLLPEQVPWLLAHGIEVQFRDPNNGPNHVHKVADWQHLQRVSNEESHPERVGGRDGEVLRMLENMRAGHVQFMHADKRIIKKAFFPWNRKVAWDPVSLNSQKIDLLRGEGLRLKLPGHPWWNCFRSTVTVRSDQQLQRIAKHDAA
jgi:hypothetical protein